MNKYAYLFKNVGLMTLASFSTKLLGFFLVPLYTHILTTEEYGIYDVFNTTIGVLLPVLTLNIQEGVLRYALDKEYDKTAIATIGARYLLYSVAIVVVALIANWIFSISAIVKDYSVFFLLMYISQAITGLISFYARGMGRIAELSIASVISSIATISFNFLFLIGFRWGLIGYFLASVVGPMMQNLFLMIRCGIIKDIHIKSSYRRETKELLSYSIPLIANGIAWWVNSASDRYAVVFFCGLAANGVYSVASKIPSLLNVFQSIFNQAWTLSAVKEFETDDRSGFFSDTYKALNCSLTLLCSLIIVLSKPLAKVMYSKDFYVAWRYVPWLTIAVLFGGIASFLGGVFSAVKDSKAFAKGTLVGAVSNIVLNFLLIPFMGPLGAAVATVISYAEVFFIRFVQCKNYISIRIKLVRDICGYIILVIQSIIISLVTEEWILLILLGMSVLALVLLFLQDIVTTIGKMRTMVNKRTGKSE